MADRLTPFSHADDVLPLLHALREEQADLVGAPLGGLIAAGGRRTRAGPRALAGAAGAAAARVEWSESFAAYVRDEEGATKPTRLDPPMSERLGDMRAETLVVVGDRDVPDFGAIARHLAEHCRVRFPRS